MAEITEWLPPRRVGANMTPWRFIATDDRTGDPRDWTVDRDGNADQHTATFSLLEWDETVVIDEGNFNALGANGEMLYDATLADVSDPTIAAGRYIVIVRVYNNAGDAVDVWVFGQMFLGVP